jgi:phosphate starvation-inducible PhoH-like protein
MIEAIERLRRIKGIGVVELNRSDIVRHHLVQSIVRAYRNERSANTKREPA